MKKHILILGANGQLALHTAHLTLYLRRASRLKNAHTRRVTVVQGDVLDSKTLVAAMLRQEFVYDTAPSRTPTGTRPRVGSPPNWRYRQRCTPAPVWA